MTELRHEMADGSGDCGKAPNGLVWPDSGGGRRLEESGGGHCEEKLRLANAYSYAAHGARESAVFSYRESRGQLFLRDLGSLRKAFMYYWLARRLDAVAAENRKAYYRCSQISAGEAGF
jgi:hypothetical protein